MVSQIVASGGGSLQLSADELSRSTAVSVGFFGGEDFSLQRGIGIAPVVAEWTQHPDVPLRVLFTRGLRCSRLCLTL